MTLKGHSNTVVALHCDASKLISASLDGTLRFWDLRAHKVGRCLRTLHRPVVKGSHQPSSHVGVTSMAVRGTELACGFADGTVWLYNFKPATAGGGVGGGRRGCGGNKNKSSRKGNNGLSPGRQMPLVRGGGGGAGGGGRGKARRGLRDLQAQCKNLGRQHKQTVSMGLRQMAFVNELDTLEDMGFGGEA